MNGLVSFSEPISKQERRSRRTTLEGEREKVRAQLTELRSRLGQFQKNTGPSKGPSKHGGVSKKRPATGFVELSGDAKRQKLEAERAKRVGGIWQQCYTILKTLLKSKDAFAFSKPVNPIAAKCPDYHEIIKRPMDLGTIQKKIPGKGKTIDKRLEQGEYSSPLEFRDDVRLVWENCRTYNAVGHAVRTMGDSLSEIWEKKWAISGIEAKWEEEQRRQELEERELAGGLSLAQQLQALDDSLQQKVSTAEAQQGYVAPPEGSAMSFEQKRRLSIALGQLPGDKISEVMRIIIEDEHMKQKFAGAEEAEVDIDQLSTETLWKLDHYAAGVLQAMRKKAGHKSIPQAAPPSKPAAANDGDVKLPNGDQENPAAQSSSSSSSIDSDTDHSRSESGGEVGSKDLGGAQQSTGTAPVPASQQRAASGDNDAVTLVSATRPPGSTQIVRNMASKKEVNLQNANAWADLGNTKPEDAAADGVAENDDAEDNLWDEFKSREQEEEQREEEKRAEEERQKREKQRAEETAKAETERLQKEAEDQERACREEEEARINAQREKEMEEMEKVGNADFAAGATEIMDSKKQGDTLTNVLGLQRRESDSDSSSDSDD